LSGKVAIVTGGGKGIGRAIALGLAQFGRIDILVNNAARSFLRPLLKLREDGWDKIFDTNCGAVFLLSCAVARQMIEEGGGRIINMTTVGAERGGRNLAACHANKAALKMLTMCTAAEGAQYDINVNPSTAPSTSSGQALRRGSGQGSGHRAVGPGVTRTYFSQPLWGNPDLAERIVSAIPKGRIAEPEEIVGAVLFLASDASSFITGQTIYVDGGFLAG
jgi:NAD(P)-dependent dehydrogenase (short-subunit alcohol dehydrogenase family)